MKKILLAICIIIQASCSNVEPLKISKDQGEVDFSQLVDGAWTQFCVFSPYSNNEDARLTLGFDWELEEQSSIANFDNIALLVFVKNKTVEKAIELSREADFTPMGGKCFERNKSKFSVKNGSVIRI